MPGWPAVQQALHMEVMVQRLGPCDHQASLPLRVRAEWPTLASTVKSLLDFRLFLAAYVQALFKQACPVIGVWLFFYYLPVLCDLLYYWIPGSNRNSLYLMAEKLHYKSAISDTSAINICWKQLGVISNEGAFHFKWATEKSVPNSRYGLKLPWWKRNF